MTVLGYTISRHSAPGHGRRHMGSTRASSETFGPSQSSHMQHCCCVRCEGVTVIREEF